MHLPPSASPLASDARTPAHDPAVPDCRVAQVVATPDIEQFTLEDGDEFLILACDGIWDVLTNQEVRAGAAVRRACWDGIKAHARAFHPGWMP